MISSGSGSENHDKVKEGKQFSVSSYICDSDMMLVINKNSLFFSFEQSHIFSVSDSTAIWKNDTAHMKPWPAMTHRQKTDPAWISDNNCQCTRCVYSWSDGRVSLFSSSSCCSQLLKAPEANNSVLKLHLHPVPDTGSWLPHYAYFQISQ